MKTKILLWAFVMILLVSIVNASNYCANFSGTNSVYCEDFTNGTVDWSVLGKVNVSGTLNHNSSGLILNATGAKVFTLANYTSRNLTMETNCSLTHSTPTYPLYFGLYGGLGYAYIYYADNTGSRVDFMVDDPTGGGGGSIPGATPWNNNTFYNHKMYFNTSWSDSARRGVLWYWNDTIKYDDGYTRIALWEANVTILKASNVGSMTCQYLRIYNGTRLPADGNWQPPAADTIVVYNTTYAAGLNFSIYHEDNPPYNLSADVDVEGSYWTSTNPNPIGFNFSFDSVDHFGFSNTANDTTNISLDMYIQYTTSDGFTHRYYLVNNTMNNITQQFSLYNFNYTTGISDLILTARERSTYNYFGNVIGKLQRRYVGESVWRTVQMDQSGDYGQLFYNILEETTDYRIIFMDLNNNVLQTTDTMKFICTDSKCEITYLLTPYSAGVAEDVNGYVVYDNDTSIITAFWTDVSGDTVDFRSVVLKDTASGTLTICDQTSTGSSGNQTCDITGHIGNIMVRTSSVTNGVTSYEGTKVIEVRPSALYTVMGNVEGAFWTFAIVLTIVMFGLFSPAGSVIALVFGLIAAYALGLTNIISYVFLIIACILGVVIGIKVKN